MLQPVEREGRTRDKPDLSGSSHHRQMKAPRENVFIITIEPVEPPSNPAKDRHLLHGRDAMDHNSLGDSVGDADSSKTLIRDDKKTSSSKTSQWLRTQFTKLRTSRTRQALLAFFLVTLAAILAVLLWLDSTGRLHELTKVREKITIPYSFFIIYV